MTKKNKKNITCTYHNPYTRKLYRALCKLSREYYNSSTIVTSQLSNIAMIMGFDFGNWFVRNLYTLQKEQYICILLKEDLNEFWIDIIPF